MGLQFKIFMKGFFRWLLITAVIFSIIFIVRAFLFNEPVIDGSEMFFTAVQVIVLFAFCCGMADAFHNWRIKQLEKEKTEQM